MKFDIFKIAVFVLALFLNLQSQNLNFFRERIELNITKNNCILKGIYYFRNNGNIPVDKIIYYPFSKRFNLSNPDSVKISDLSNNKIIFYNNLKDGITFNILIPANDQIVIEVVYYQKTPDQKMEYILTTTKKWKRPLEKAEYIINIDSELTLESLSMEYDYKKCTDKFITYFISKNEFMPDSNLLLEWRKIK